MKKSIIYLLKKSIIYLCLIIFVSMITFNSCCTNDKDKLQSDEITIEQIQPYGVIQLEDENLLADYYVIETNIGKEIIIDDLISYKIEEIICLKEIKLSDTEAKATICNQNLYEIINEPEYIYEQSKEFISFYKKARDGVIYHKCVYYTDKYKSPIT